MSRAAKPLDFQVPVSRPLGRHRRGLYAFLFAIQTVGAVLLCSEILPIYRKVLADPTAPKSGRTFLALGAGVLIQLGYWICYRIRPVLPRLVNVPLGHIVLFVSRLIFVLPTAIFSFLFVARTLEAPIPISRYLAIAFGLFSLFCYVRELEWLGTHLLGKTQQ
jgi:hypothetical protein